MRYEIEDATTGEVLSKHRTRQGAIDGWRTRHAERTVRVVRCRADGRRVVVVEGTWHEAKNAKPVGLPDGKRVGGYAPNTGPAPNANEANRDDR